MPSSGPCGGYRVLANAVTPRLATASLAHDKIQ